MAAGFVVVALDENGQPAEYWDGTAFQEDVDLADFITTKQEAKYVAGSNQAVKTDTDVVYKAATQDISLA